jgi:hypothetical protein
LRAPQAIYESLAVTFVCIYGFQKLSKYGEDPGLYTIGAATLTLAVIIVRTPTAPAAAWQRCARRMRSALIRTPCLRSRMPSWRFGNGKPIGGSLA